MKKLSKKVTALALICCLSGASAIFLKGKSVTESKAFVGIGYLAAKRGASAKKCAAIGIVGVYEGAIQSACWGAAFGGPAGAAAGIVVGL
jgi:hypothetical protein